MNIQQTVWALGGAGNVAQRFKHLCKKKISRQAVQQWADRDRIPDHQREYFDRVCEADGVPKPKANGK